MKSMKRITALVMISVLCIEAFAVNRYPEARRDSILKCITGARMPSYKINILQAGAKGNGIKDCKPAFDKVMRTAERKGGAHIIVPSGTYIINGPIQFVSNVCLELQEGAVLKFSSDPRHYLPTVRTSWEGTLLQNYSPMIYGYGLTNISIIGNGTIDGNAAKTFATWRARQKTSQSLSREYNHKEVPVNERNFGEGHYLRPQLIQFFNCRNITISGVFITNSPFWCIHLLKSENIICRGLRYDAKLVNNDGIDPEASRNILIEDISFNNGDDNVAIKSGRDNDGWHRLVPAENIIIRNCRFKGLHAVVMGSEMSAGIQNIFVEDCTFAGYCKRGIYVKTNPDRGGFVRDIYIRNCEFDEVEDLFYVTSMYAGEGNGSKNYSAIENIYVENLRCRRARAAGIVLQGTETKPIRNVTFRNVNIDKVENAVSIDNTENAVMDNCHLGGKAGIPTQASPKDNLGL
nr:glycoside hydrolase family 28 protein [Xylanibacter caecicola]